MLFRLDSARRPRACNACFSETTFSIFILCSLLSNLALWLSTRRGHEPNGAGLGGSPPPQLTSDSFTLLDRQNCSLGWPSSLLRARSLSRGFFQTHSGQPARQVHTCPKPSETQAAESFQPSMESVLFTMAFRTLPEQKAADPPSPWPYSSNWSLLPGTCGSCL